MVGHRRSRTVAAAAVGAGAVLLAACTGSGAGGPPSRGLATGTTSGVVGATSVTSVPAGPTAPTGPATTSTVDPGALPQTPDLPSTTDPAFTARMGDLLQAVTAGEPGSAAPAFFPLGAYLQVKAISDPEHDYRTRLISDFDQDILALHAALAAAASPPILDSVVLEQRPQWIVPGVEYNKGSYWRVYGTRVDYSVGGQRHSFTIASMISWRGEWYVVHLSSIR